MLTRPFYRLTDWRSAYGFGYWCYWPSLVVDCIWSLNATHIFFFFCCISAPSSFLSACWWRQAKCTNLFEKNTQKTQKMKAGIASVMIGDITLQQHYYRTATSLLQRKSYFFGKYGLILKIFQVLAIAQSFLCPNPSLGAFFILQLFLNCSSRVGRVAVISINPSDHTWSFWFAKMLMFSTYSEIIISTMTKFTF